jgi:anionic cell wall polymer biosynthesis LytR-Cps2A-Psr (LCP) family protein
VEIDLPDGLDRDGVTLAPGTHVLDGGQALAYVRDRFTVPGGDLGRVQRQQNWLRAMAREALSRDTLGDPAGLLGLVETAAGTVAVDEGFTLREMSKLVLSLRGVRADDVAFLTAPTAGLGRSPDGRESIVLLDGPRFDALAAAVAADRVPEHLAAHPGEVPVLGAVVP